MKKSNTAFSAPIKMLDVKTGVTHYLDNKTAACQFLSNPPESLGFKTKAVISLASINTSLRGDVPVIVFGRFAFRFLDGEFGEFSIERILKGQKSSFVPVEMRHHETGAVYNSFDHEKKMEELLDRMGLEISDIFNDARNNVTQIKHTFWQIKLYNDPRDWSDLKFKAPVVRELCSNKTSHLTALMNFSRRV